VASLNHNMNVCQAPLWCYSTVCSTTCRLYATKPACKVAAQQVQSDRTICVASHAMAAAGSVCTAAAARRASAVCVAALRSAARRRSASASAAPAAPAAASARAASARKSSLSCARACAL